MKRTLITEYQGNYGEFFKKEAQKAANRFDDTIVIDDIPRWPTNNQIPPMDLLELWHYCDKPFDFDKTVLIRETESAASIAEYKKRMRGRQYSEVDLAEMRSVFGVGTAVVDVITGEKITV